MEKILVADKDKQTVKMVSTMLALEGYKISSALNPADVLNKVDSESPAIVLIDMNMHGGSFDLMLSDLKKSDDNLQIILMTTYSTDIYAEELSRKGVSDYISKPFTKNDLLKSIKSSAFAMSSVSKEIDEPVILIAAEMRSDIQKLSGKIGPFKSVKTSPLRRVLSVISREDIDILIVDVTGAEIDVSEFLRKISLRNPGTDVLLVSRSKDINFIKNVIREGAFDCITKPFEDVEIQKALTSLIALRKKKDIEGLKKRYERELIKHKEQLDHIMSVIESLIFALEARDKYTQGHSERVTEYSVQVGKAMGLDDSVIERIKHSSRLHDIGKIGIDDSILKKPAGLTSEEQAIMRDHPVVGEKILKPVRYLSHLLPGIRHHHERFDGNGYPDKIAGKKIPIEARIIAVADTYDAMRSSRPYRKKMELETVIEEVERSAGSQLDPEIVDVFLNILRSKGEFKEAPNEKGGKANIEGPGKIVIPLKKSEKKKR